MSDGFNWEGEFRDDPWITFNGMIIGDTFAGHTTNPIWVSYYRKLDKKLVKFYTVGQATYDVFWDECAKNVVNSLDLEVPLESLQKQREIWLQMYNSLLCSSKTENRFNRNHSSNTIELTNKSFIHFLVNFVSVPI